jgi:hypothetical protein
LLELENQLRLFPVVWREQQGPQGARPLS